MEDLQNISELVNTVFNSVQLDPAGNAHRILSSWEKVLLSIKSYNPNEGQNLVSHSRVVDLKNGVLLIEADHPGWIELLQMRKKYILKGMQMRSPGMEINTLAFRLKGKRASLYSFGESSAPSQEKEVSRMEKRLEQEEEILRKKVSSENSFQKTAAKKPLPAELESIFADLKKSMLTNSE